MSSSHQHNSLGAGRHDLASRARRSAIAVAVAAGIATGSAVALTAASATPDVIAQTATTMQAPHAGATSAAFVRRVRTLEAAGYVDVACAVHGELMFNPRRHRYVTIPA